MDFNFVIGTAPDEDTIITMHKILVKALVKKYGIETIQEIIKKTEINNDLFKNKDQE